MKIISFLRSKCSSNFSLQVLDIECNHKFLVCFINSTRFGP